MRTHPAARSSAAVFLVSAVLLGGCATIYDVKVDAISRPADAAAAAKAKEPVKETASYRLKNKNPSTDEDNLRYKEATNYVKTALSGRGLYEAPANVTPDIIVELDYGVEAPSVRMEKTSVPVYVQTGGGVSYNPLSVPAANGAVLQRTVPVYDAPHTELVGYQEVMVPVAIYEKYLHISARENREVHEGQAPAEIWSVNTSYEDESKDIRKYLPLLASASMESIGTDTGSRKTIKLKESDQDVGFVKKGL
ncbi:MAG TPA: hypothetical protein VG838_10195 [Opitutaceae bacterium]|nr:hypothetical protein [Opitutaceae bacterium]